MYKHAFLLQSVWTLLLQSVHCTIALACCRVQPLELAAVFNCSCSLQCTAAHCRVYNSSLQSGQPFTAACTTTHCRVNNCLLQHLFSLAAVYGGSLQCTVVRSSVRRFAVECTVVHCRVHSGSLQSVQWFAAECTVVCCRVYGGSLQSVWWFAAECIMVRCRVYYGSLQSVRRFAAESTAVCCRVYGGLLQSVRQFAGVYSGSLQSTIFTMENPHHLLMICFWFFLF